MREYDFYVYIMSSYSKILYIGVNNDLNRRVWEHKHEINPHSFSAKYKTKKLVYYEHFNNINEAINREKQIKRWRREKKIWLIEQINPQWFDLSEEWI